MKDWLPSTAPPVARSSTVPAPPGPEAKATLPRMAVALTSAWSMPVTASPEPTTTVRSSAK